MEALKLEMEARKARTNELKERTGSGKRKFVRRGELAAAEQREVEEKREALDIEYEKRKSEAIDQRRGGAELNDILLNINRGANNDSKNKINDSKNTTGSNNEDEEGELNIPLSSDEVKQRLRAMGQPVTYFGESNRLRYNRMRKIEEEGVDDDFAISGGHNTRNIFLDQDSRGAADKDDDDFDDDDDDDGTPKSHKTKKHRHEDDEDGEDGDFQLKSTNGVNVAMKKVGDTTEVGELTDSAKHRRVRDYFRDLIRAWEQSLNERPDHIKRTALGKIETKTQKQCKDYIRPLFKLCKKREVPTDILESLYKITDFCAEGEFVKANDAYIVTAIGKAAWPIGVTSVGIHNRSAHDKMQTGQVAHVMNNEMQRKYLQSVKRLIRFEQNRRVDVPPSKKVL